MSNFGLVSTLSAPVLKSVTQPSLIRFETDFNAYAEKVKDINRSRDEKNKIVPATIKNCIEPALLSSLCILGQIQGAKSVEEAQESAVEEWFTTRIRSKPRDLAERVRSAIDTVTYTQCKEDPAGAALTFVLDIVKSLEVNNASEVIQDKDRTKGLIVKLVNKLEPPELKERIKDALECWSNEEKASLSFFQERIATTAVDVAQGEIARARLKRKHSHRRNSDGSQKHIEDVKKRHKKETNQFTTSENKKKSNKNSKKGWKYSCLNPNCPEKHMMKDCKSTSEEMKKELLAEFYEEKKNLKSVTRVPVVPTPNAAEGRYQVMIEDKIQAVALGDYGSDINAIPASIYETVIASEPTITTQTLPKPMLLKLAIANATEQGSDFTASRTSYMSVTIVLNGSNIPVRIRGVEFAVVDQEMDEVLLGRPFLKAIGFDLEEHLQRVHRHVHDKHIEELQSSRVKLAAVEYKGMAYQEIDDDPIDLPDVASAGFGKDSKEEIDEALERNMEEARCNGLSPKGQERLKNILLGYRDVFRLKLGPDPPANVAPLIISPVHNARPFRSPQRRYSTEARAFITNTVRELVEIGALYKNPSSRWASPALAVPKPGTKKLRFTVDLRRPNTLTVPIQSAMPHLESRLQDTEGSTCFANIDMTHGYWQIALDKTSREMHSIQTPIGVHTPVRILQGGSDSGSHFQAVTEEKFNEGGVEKMLQWIDDFLLYARHETELLENIDKFLRVCKEVGFKVHPKKTTFFTKKAKFCGRILSTEGVQYEPRNFSVLLNMRKPTHADQLQQLLCATNWMRNSIPTYSTTIAPLHKLLEDAYKTAGKRTKKAVRRIRLDSSWGAEHDRSFELIKKQLAASTKLAHPKVDHTMCLFTDASESHWAAILTQTPKTQFRKPIDQQEHAPLCFLSGAFTGSSFNWSMPEKEGYAIVEAMCRLDYLVCGNVVSIFTDHANLVYLYDPFGRNPGIPRHTASKLMRWALKLSAFRYIVEHIPGEKNVWADMLTRWAVKECSAIKPYKNSSLKALLVCPINPSLNSELDWPTRQCIMKSQFSSNEEPPKPFSEVDGVRQNEKGTVWIPSQDKELQLRILIAGHMGMAGHRGYRTTKATIATQFYWDGINNDIERLVKSCIHCLSTKPGDIVPRPLGHGLHGEKPNDVLHFDYCYMMLGQCKKRYVLILKDDLSGYVWLVPTEDTDAQTTAQILLNWFASFGVPQTWVSDRGSHFKNELIRLLRESTKGSHHFTLAYCPWSNGSVEVVCRELLRATRALLSEFQLPQNCWPSIMPLVQSVLNNTVLQRLGNRCPLTAFTGMPQNSPLRSIMVKRNEFCTVRSIQEAQCLQRLQVEKVIAALEMMHRDVKLMSDKKRKTAVDAHNRKTNVRPINFCEGDFVLRGTLQRERRSKPALKWHGPYRVTNAESNYIFEIEDLLTGKKEKAHGRRLKFFQNKYFEVTEELRNHLSYQNNELFLIHSFDDIRKRNGACQLLVSWKGFSDEERDWVDIDLLKKNAPNMVEEHLSSLIDSGTTRQRKIASSI